MSTKTQTFTGRQSPWYRQTVTMVKENKSEPRPVSLDIKPANLEQTTSKKYRGRAMETLLD